MWESTINGVGFFKGEVMKCRGFDSRCKSNKAKTYRQNTRYEEDERNIVTLCRKCAKANEEYWEEIWITYWSDVL